MRYFSSSNSIHSSHTASREMQFIRAGNKRSMLYTILQLSVSQFVCLYFDIHYKHRQNMVVSSKVHQAVEYNVTPSFTFHITFLLFIIVVHGGANFKICNANLWADNRVISHLLKT